MTLPFLKPRLLDEAEIQAYEGEIAGLDDDGLVRETADQVFNGGFSPLVQTHHGQRCSACYREAVRRGREWLYAKGHNRAVVDAGGHLDDRDIERAKPRTA